MLSFVDLLNPLCLFLCLFVCMFVCLFYWSSNIAVNQAKRVHLHHRDSSENKWLGTKLRGKGGQWVRLVVVSC